MAFEKVAYFNFQAWMCETSSVFEAIKNSANSDAQQAPLKTISEKTLTSHSIPNIKLKQ